MSFKKSYSYLFFSALIFGGAFEVTGQATTSTTAIQVESNDPIVETLDSLVMLHNVIRYNNTLAQDNQDGVTSKNDYPRYSDEIYAQRMGKIFSPIPLTYNPEVKKYLEMYAYHKRGLTSRVMGLADLYFPLFEEALDKEGLPLELKYLAIVESALNPIAVSKMGATGLWQFMYHTGKHYDLQINSWVDERRDPEKSTYAACNYFKDMYAIYGDWLLVIASYNCGPGNVNKAIRRAGGKTSFWEIAKYLPAETRGYVPAFIAITYVMNYAGEHGIFPIQPTFNYFEVDTVAIEQQISLRKIADAVNLPYDVISYLNPVYKRGIIPQTDQPNVLRLPTTSVAAYLAAEKTLFEPSQLASADKTPVTFTSGGNTDKPTGAYKLESKKIKKVYTVKSGDNLSTIANRTSSSVAELKKWNKLHSDRIQKGQRLSYFAVVKVKVPIESEQTQVAENPSKQNAEVSETKNPTEQSAKANTAESLQSKSDIIYHLVQKGDTLWNIAKRYEGTTVEQLMEINKITNTNSLVPGTKIKVKING